MGGAYIGQFAMYATFEIAHMAKSDHVCATQIISIPGSTGTGIGITPSQQHENQPAIRSLQGGSKPESILARYVRCRATPYGERCPQSQQAALREDSW
jgi:hypothetical protein